MWWWSTAWAHQPGLSYAAVEPDRIVITFSEREVMDVYPLGRPDAIDQVSAWVLDGLKVAVVEGPCAEGEPSVRRVENDGLEVTVGLDCPGGGPRTLEAGYLSAFGTDHRHLVEQNGAPVATLDAQGRTATLAGEPRALEVAGQFGELGVEHILTGYDHLAFVLALMLGARDARGLFWLVTTFTVAHSLTLGAATLELIRLPSSVVEPLIAASIAFVGVENLVRPPLGRRMALTFAFGLVHGLGFAGLLAELGVPRSSLALALVSFNLGVEAGQLAVVAVAMAVMWPLRRHPRWEDRIAPGLSLVLALAGVGWLVERLSG